MTSARNISLHACHPVQSPGHTLIHWKDNQNISLNKSHWYPSTPIPKASVETMILSLTSLNLSWCSVQLCLCERCIVRSYKVPITRTGSIEETVKTSSIQDKKNDGLRETIRDRRNLQAFSQRIQVQVRKNTGGLGQGVEQIETIHAGALLQLQGQKKKTIFHLLQECRRKVDKAKE